MLLINQSDSALFIQPVNMFIVSFELTITPNSSLSGEPTATIGW